MRYTLFLLLLIAFNAPAFAPNDPPSSGPGTLQEQYRDLKSDLDVINGFRMVKLYTMDKFWNVVTDTLQNRQAKIRESAVIIARQQQEAQALNAALATTQKEKEELQSGVENLAVLGMLFSKSGFVRFITFVIVALLVLAGVLFWLGRVSRGTTSELRKLNESIYQEFDAYKRHAVEKEIKLSRELQNHRNRLAELKIA